jgi:DNA-binding MarR family transcriptional regulator
VDAPDWLDAEEQHAWRALAGVMTLLPAALDAQLQRDAGLTHFAYWVLAMLSEAPDRTLVMSELATASRSSLSRLSHAVTRLERQGLVARRKSSSDARVTLLQLTDAGWQTVVAAAPGHAATVRALVFDGLSRNEVVALGSVSARLLERLGTTAWPGPAPA